MTHRRKNPQRVAWIVLIFSFLIFCALAVGGPLSIRAWVRHASVYRPPLLRVVRGTVLLEVPGHSDLIPVTRERTVEARTEVRTDETSWATLSIFSGGEQQVELATVQIYNQTQLRLLDSRSPRFSSSSDPNRLLLRLDAGRIRVTSSQPGKRPIRITVSTPHGEVALAGGSYSLFVSNNGTEVTARTGEADVTAMGVSRHLRGGERTMIPLGSVPQLQVPAEYNLVHNGNFLQPLASTWRVGWAPKDPKVDPGTVSIVNVGGRYAALLSRRSPQEGVHTEVWIEQALNQDVRDADSLVIRVDVRLLYQSLSGGGYLGSEYPLMIRLSFTDIYGHNLEWVHGFYFRPPENPAWPTTYGEQIPPFIWYPSETKNLIQVWKAQGTPPATLRSLRIYASGHNYQSMVSEVGIFVR